MLLTMAVFRHLKCCDGWSFFVFLYSRWVLKRWVSCLLKWKRDRGSILRCRTVGEEKEKILLSSRKRKREKYCWSSEKSFSGFGVGRLLLNARSLLILWYHSSSVEVSDAGIDDSSVERWLFLYWKPCRILGAEIRVGTRSFIFL
jgi:hypothetical protein